MGLAAPVRPWRYIDKQRATGAHALNLFKPLGKGATFHFTMPGASETPDSSPNTAVLRVRRHERA